MLNLVCWVNKGRQISTYYCLKQTNPFKPSQQKLSNFIWLKWDSMACTVCPLPWQVKIHACINLVDDWKKFQSMCQTWNKSVFSLYLMPPMQTMFRSQSVHFSRLLRLINWHNYLQYICRVTHHFFTDILRCVLTDLAFHSDLTVNTINGLWSKRYTRILAAFFDVYHFQTDINQFQTLLINLIFCLIFLTFNSAAIHQVFSELSAALLHKLLHVPFRDFYISFRFPHSDFYTNCYTYPSDFYINCYTFPSDVYINCYTFVSFIDFYVVSQISIHNYCYVRLNISVQ